MSCSRTDKNPPDEVYEDEGNVHDYSLDLIVHKKEQVVGAPKDAHTFTLAYGRGVPRLPQEVTKNLRLEAVDPLGGAELLFIVSPNSLP